MIKNVIFATSGFFCVIIGFFFLVPAWNSVGNALSAAANNIITNPSYLSSVSTIGIDLNLLVGYSFLGMGIGIWIYLLLFAWRREAVSNSIEDQDTPYGDY